MRIIKYYYGSALLQMLVDGDSDGGEDAEGGHASADGAHASDMSASAGFSSSTQV